MNVGDKYIIEIAEVIHTDDGDLGRIKGFQSLVMTEVGLKRLEKCGEVRPELKPGAIVKYKDPDAEGNTIYATVIRIDRFSQTVYAFETSGYYTILRYGEFEVIGDASQIFDALMDAAYRTRREDEGKES